MVNKKGYLKTLEAVIAIIIIVIVSYILIPRPMETPPEVPPIVKGSQKIIDQSIQFNETLRNLITKDELSSQEYDDLVVGINSIISKQTPPGYDYTCLVCQNPGTCLAEYTPLDRSIYMTDVLVASSEEQQNVRIVRIWFWKQPTSQEDRSILGPAYNDCEIKN